MACLRCSRSPEWIDGQYESKRQHFIDIGRATRSSQVKYRVKKKQSVKVHLTLKQRQILVPVVFSRDGKAVLCTRCFCEFTGCSKSFYKRLKQKVRFTPWSELFLDDCHLQNGHVGKAGFHILPQHVLDKIKAFCGESYLFWDPRNEKICFNTDVNSWERLYAEFVTFCGEKLLSCNAFRLIVKGKVFPGYQIGRQQHTKDACDSCVTYWKAKRAFLQSLRSGPPSPEKRAEFLHLHQKWNSHIQFSYNERDYYKAKKLEAKEPTSEWLHLSVDAMRICYLPNISFGPQAHSLYFMNRLKVYLMGVFNEGSVTGHGLIWDETLRSTSSNHVMTCLWTYILLNGVRQRKLRLTLDNCAVNKSYLFVAFCVALVAFEIFEEIDLCWLVVGHTKFSPDRMFGLISSALRVSDVTTKEKWCEIISTKLGESYVGKVLETILDFSSLLDCHFRTNGFLSLDRQRHSGSVKIKQLQGIMVRKLNGSVTVHALSHHVLSESDKVLLESTRKPLSSVEVPSSLRCRLKNVYSQEELQASEEMEMLPEIPVTVVKRGSQALQGDMSFPALGEEWRESCSRQPISIDLLEDLWRANSLIVNADPCDYSAIWENLTVQERNELKKKGKIDIDVAKPVFEILHDIRTLIRSEHDQAELPHPIAESEENVQNTNSTDVASMFERLSVLDIGTEETSEIPVHEEIMEINQGEVEIIASSSLSHQIAEIEEKARASFNERQRPIRERRRRCFGEDFDV